MFHRPVSELRPQGRPRGLDHVGRQSERRTMRVGFSSSCAIGLAIAFLLGAAPTARGQQDSRRTTSTRRIPVTKDRPTRPAPAPEPVAAPRVNQDSIAAAERARQEAIAAAERNKEDERARPDPMRNVAIYSGSGGLKLNLPIFRTASRLYLMGGAGAHVVTGYATSVDSTQTIKDAIKDKKIDIGWYGGAGINLRFGRTAFFVES